MDPSTDGRAADDRVAAIRREAEAARARIAVAIAALEHKADAPSRIADAVRATASGATARALRRLRTAPRGGGGRDGAEAGPAVDTAPIPEPVPGTTRADPDGTV
jgi:hypothetical protein